MTQEKENKLREAIIQAVPEIVVNKHAQIIKFDHTVEYFEEKRPITLEDVLRAIDEKWKGLYGFQNGRFFRSDGYTNKSAWLLGKPLQDQSEETKEFLYTILCQK